MRVFDRSCETVESAARAAARRWACCAATTRTSREFIHAKDEGDLTNFNISVGVTDAFMKAVEADADVELPTPSRTDRRPPAPTSATTASGYTARCAARDLWDQVMRSTYDHAEPGILFLDRMNADNNLYYCETIEATNPCAEQPLPPYGCCCLGSINLTPFVRTPSAEGRVRLCRLRQVVDDLHPHARQRARGHPLAARATAAQKPAQSKRRVGLGFTGLGDACACCGLRYDTAEARDGRAHLRVHARPRLPGLGRAGPRERGAFPLFNADLYLCRRQLRLCACPADMKDKIRKHGLRNSHLLSIA